MVGARGPFQRPVGPRPKESCLRTAARTGSGALKRRDGTADRGKEDAKSGSLPSTKFQDQYAVLGVARKAGGEEIHRAYSALAAKHHPRTPTRRNTKR